MEYVALGVKRDRALAIAGITKHHYYHKPKKGKRGVPVSTHTIKYVQDQEVLVTKILYQSQESISTDERKSITQTKADKGEKEVCEV